MFPTEPSQKSYSASGLSHFAGNEFHDKLNRARVQATYVDKHGVTEVLSGILIATQKANGKMLVTFLASGQDASNAQVPVLTPEKTHDLKQPILVMPNLGFTKIEFI